MARNTLSLSRILLFVLATLSLAFSADTGRSDEAESRTQSLHIDEEVHKNIEVSSFSLSLEDGSELRSSAAQTLQKSFAGNTKERRFSIRSQSSVPQYVDMEFHGIIDGHSIDFNEHLILKAQKSIFGRNGLTIYKAGSDPLVIDSIKTNSYTGCGGLCSADVLEKDGRSYFDAVFLQNSSFGAVHLASNGDGALIAAIDDVSGLDCATLAKPLSKVEKTDSKSRGLQTLTDDVDKWENCFTGDNQLGNLEIGAAVGSELQSKFDNDQDVLIFNLVAVFNNANIVYENQVGVGIRMNAIYISLSDSDEWNTCEYDSQLYDSNAEYQLDKLSLWAPPAPQGLWHVFDDCLKGGGVVGMAYVSVLCEYNIGFQNRRYNTGVTQWIFSTWITFAHEVGHKFGADHSFEEGVGSTGGIMDYGDGSLDGVYQFNTQYRKSEMCSTIQSQLVNSQCAYFYYGNGDTTCGDGLVQSSEECDCGDGSTSCRFCTDCKLDSGKQCSPDQPFQQCCSDEGYFATAQLCDIMGQSGTKGYCLADGTCQDPNCAQYGFELCDVSECKVSCTNEYSCFNYEGYVDSVTRIPINWMKDGTLCQISDNEVGSCYQGSCVEDGEGYEDYESPTESPTLAPIGQPTQHPTKNPTKSPTPFPTESPTPKVFVLYKNRALWSVYRTNDVQSLMDARNFLYGSTTEFTPGEFSLSLPVPDQVRLRKSLQVPRRLRWKFVSSLEADIKSDRSGQHELFLACSDSCEMFLDGERVAFVEGGVKRNEFGATEDQRSGSIRLEKGQKYSLVVHHLRQTSSRYHLSVAWKRPRVRGRKIIKGKFLEVLASI